MNEQSEQNEKKNIIVIILVVLLVLILAIIGWILWSRYKAEKEQEKESDFSSYAELLGKTDEGEMVSEDTNGVIENPLAELQRVNSDIVAWIKIPDTAIDLPVVQGEDNEFYLNRGLDKEYSGVGVPFLDYRNQRDFTDFNSVVYGHHIKNHRIYTDLTLFKEKEFFDEHDTYTITLEDGEHSVRIMACLVVPSDSSVYKTVFLTGDEGIEWYQYVAGNALCYRELEDISLLMKNMEISNLSQIRFITLSTCSYEYEDARTVVVGVID